ncbi:MAG TPA: phosphopantetheine-binding protein [Vicinamibacterales bacterium]|nr:phosphopantetheine-binding protein [Vicinamibacterales bacterium]
MSDERLTSCFRVVFPDLSDEQIRTAHMRRLGKWDSSALLRLIALVERAYGVRFTLQQLATLNSFEEFHRLLGSIAPESPAQKSDDQATTSRRSSSCDRE